eukprot:168639-Hanusia_phi.AAC.1
MSSVDPSSAVGTMENLGGLRRVVGLGGVMNKFRRKTVGYRSSENRGTFEPGWRGMSMVGGKFCTSVGVV